MADEYTLDVKRFEPQDPRLGRHVCHDSRSRRFRAPARSPATLKSVRHAVHIPIMDQGDVGSCTGHAGTNALASDPFWRAGQGAIGPGDPHTFAVALYGAATLLDPWPGAYTPDDTGSDGLSIAKVLHARGLVSGYEHAFSLAATLSGLAERVVMIGSAWHEGMYYPAADGRLAIAGNVVGGHEFVLDELDVERERVWLRNSWGPSWALEGRAWLSWADLGALLADDGDCTILIPRTEPPPQPQPVPIKKRTAEEQALAGALELLLDNKNAPKYLRQPAQAWMATFKE